MRSPSLKIPAWVRKALKEAAASGIIEEPPLDWTNTEISSFFRMHEQCWLISDVFTFTLSGMVCNPQLAMRPDDPRVIEQCDFLAKILNAAYEIIDLKDGIRVEFTRRSQMISKG